jgi:tungstate transport system ATP-binding protein
LTDIIKLRNVTKEYGNISALDDVAMTIWGGEVIVLVGPNGSGKTTLLRIISGIETPTRGEVFFQGAKIDSKCSKLAKSVTMVFQKTVMFSGTVFDNVAYGLKLKGHSRSRVEAVVKEALRTVKLEGFEKRRAKRLSGGEQQRVAIARALALDTQVLLLDEPTANVDPRNASIIENVLQTISKQKTTVLIATQNMAQAKNLANRVAVLNRGKIDKIGSFQEVFGYPSMSLVDFARLENVFAGISRITEEGTSIVDVGDGVSIVTTFEKSGNVAIYVRPEDIILSAQPLVSSARNMFRGRIGEISDLGSTVRLKVKAGKDFSVQVTRKSFDEMKLNLDSSVFLAFKASSVQIT